MHKKHLVFVFRSSPYGSSRAREGLDALLAAAVFEQSISVLFLGDGVLQLYPNQNPPKGRNQHKMLLSLGLYDVEQVYFSDSALSRHNLDAADIGIPGKVLKDAEINQVLNTADQVLTF